MDQRKSIWKQLGGDIDNESLNNSFISIPNHKSMNNMNGDNASNDSQIFHSQDENEDGDDNENDGDDDENESNELILEFEISDDGEIDINGNKENINTATSNELRPKAMNSNSEVFMSSPYTIHTDYVCYVSF